jgi:hypothetical protein
VDDFRPRPDVAKSFYPQPGRPEISLDGKWNVKMDPDRRGFGEKWFAREDVPFEQVLEVPGNWNAQGLGGPGRIAQTEMGSGMEAIGMRLTAQFQGSYHGLAWYRRQVNVPAGWAGRRINLVFGGILSSVRLWVNGEFAGGRWTDGNAFSFDVTDLVKPGRSNTLAMAVNNHWKETATLSHYQWYVPVGGLWHHLVLRALPRVHLRSALVRPELEGPEGPGVAQVHISVMNCGAAEREAALTATVARARAGRRFQATGRLRVAGGQAADIVLPIRINPVEPWSLETPRLYDLTVKLAAGEERDSLTDRFGMRTLAAAGNRFELNKLPFFVLGQHFHFFWPNATVPPIARQAYVKILRRFKNYGFNYLRVPWLMPEECYQAADEVGMLLQLEFPYAFAPYDKIKRPLIKRLIQECLEAYGNHPSLALLCMSNEGSWDQQGALNPEFCAFSKFLDPTRLVLDTDGQPDDKLAEHAYADVFTPMNHSSDWKDYMQRVSRRREEYALRPTLDHEFLNVPTLPRIDTFAKFGGALVALPPQIAEELPRQLQAQGLADEYGQYLRASYRQQFNFIKEGIERTRKNPLKAGFSMCAWNDIECGCHWGILDAFQRPKAIPPEAMRVFNAPSVLLMDSIDPATRRPAAEINYCHCAADGFAVQPCVAHFDRQPLAGAILTWSLENARGGKLVGGQIRGFGVEHNAVTALPQIAIGPIRLTQPAKTTLKLSLTGPKFKLENSWPIWLFPKVRRAKIGRTVFADPELFGRIADVVEGAVAADAQAANADQPGALWVTGKGDPARAWLAAGKAVLFLAGGGEAVGSQNPFDPGWFKSDQHMGSLVRAHRALGDFPHDGFASWQFRYLVNRRKDIPEGRIAGRPVISSVFNDTLPHVQHALFVANLAGGGHLTYCQLKVLAGRCEADYLLKQLLENAGRDPADPQMPMEEAAKF